ncbi:MAG: ABC transporter substrate-binding protein [Planctomycetia bacterium]
MILRILLLLACLALTACSPEAGSASGIAQSAAGTTGATAPQAKGARLLPTTTAAAELLCLIADPEDVLALPEQADRYSVEDFSQNGWGQKPRFAKYEAEVLAAYEPLLVVNHRWQSEDTNRTLRKLGIPVISLESGTSYGALRGSVLQLGLLIGRELRARAAVAELDRRVGALSARAPSRKPKLLVYANDGTTGWAAGANTTANTMLELAGMENAAVGAGIEGHGVCSFEMLLAIDPDWIVMARPARDEAGTPTREVLEKTPVLRSLRAREQGHLIELSAALISSDSHHILHAAEELLRQYETLSNGKDAPR